MEKARQRVVRLMRKQLLGSENKRMRDAVRRVAFHPKTVAFRDEIAFFLGLVNVMVTEAVLLVHPKMFPAWYIGWLAVLLATRAVLFTARRSQLFLLDMCYAANILTVVVLYVAPSLRWSALVLTTGPVAAALVAWRNSLVLHDLNHTTTVAIHALAPLVMLSERFLATRATFTVDGRPPCDGVVLEQLQWVRWAWPASAMPPATTPGSCEPLPDPLTLYWQGFAAYAAWQVAHLFVSEVILGRWIEDHPELETSMRYLTTRGSLRKGVAALCVQMGVMAPGEEMDASTFKTKTIFVVSQLVFTLVTLIPGVMCAYSLELAALWMAGLLAGTAMNGAQYYMEVFANKYKVGVEERWAKLVKEEVVGAVVEAAEQAVVAAAQDGHVAQAVADAAESAASGATVEAASRATHTLGDETPQRD